MSQEVRDAFGRLLARLQRGPVTLWGDPGPDRTLLDRARRHGALEIADGVRPSGCVVIPMTGLTQESMDRLKACDCLDLTLPCLRRVRAMIRLLQLEQRRVIVVGDRNDAQCGALSGEGRMVVADVDAVMRLPFFPRFGLVAAPHLSGARWATLSTALKRRHPDSSVVILDTRDPALIEREKRLLSLAPSPDPVLIFSDAADPSGRALFEAARFAGMEARHLHELDEVLQVLGDRRHILATGLFSPFGVSTDIP